MTDGVTSYTTCKSKFVGDTPDTITCVEYSYNAVDRKLRLNHINVMFNCCSDSFYCDMSISNDTIKIQEFESGLLCFCVCLFDISMEFNEVDPLKYYVSIYQDIGSDSLNFVMDLTDSQDSSYCEVRTYGPYGGDY